MKAIRIHYKIKEMSTAGLGCTTEIPAFAKSLEDRDRPFAGAIKPVAETDPILTYNSALQSELVEWSGG